MGRRLSGERPGKATVAAGVCLLAVAMGGAPWLQAQSCTTQAKMTPEVRTGIGDAAMSLADGVKAGDAAKVQTLTIAEFATNFAPTAYLVHNTATKVTNDTLQVEQVYLLDAQGRKAGDTSDAEFSCALSDTTAETDFAIPGLPPGLYGFAMVAATGERPYLLAFLLRKDAGVWKMAGFYPRATTAAGHDGLWYWRMARSDGADKETWLAWVLYGLADDLLRPANFVTSTNLDKLRTERSSAAPPELANGLSAETPLVVKGSDGTEYRFSSIGAEGSEDGKHLNLSLHVKADFMADAVAAKARNEAAARALLDSHKELRQGMQDVVVVAESEGHEPFVTEEPITNIQ
jgi:hypothetical protein